MVHTAKLIAHTQPCSSEQGSNLEEFVAYTARVSNPGNQSNHETGGKLLAYLIKNKHWSPLEMATITLEVRTTRAIARQMLRHRFAFQEFSLRYAEHQAFHLSEARLQDTKNRQNSTPTLDTTIQDEWLSDQEAVLKLAEDLYQKAINKGIAKEVARNILPEGLTGSTMYVTGSLRQWLHYLQLRLGNGTQKEHRILAESCRDEILKVAPSLKEWL